MLEGSTGIVMLLALCRGISETAGCRSGSSYVGAK
jgi:hypothetical protein